MKNQTELNTVWESLGISNNFMFGKVMQDAESVRLDVYVKDSYYETQTLARGDKPKKAQTILAS